MLDFFTHNQFLKKYLYVLVLIFCICIYSGFPAFAQHTKTENAARTPIRNTVAAPDTTADSASTANAPVIAEWPAAPEIYGEAVILMDADSGAILYSKNAEEKLYPASITKIMTGLLAIEKLSLNDTVTYTESIIYSLPYDASKLGLLPNETVTVNDTLYALLLRSANEAAVALAVKCSGSESEFAKEMTLRAQAAGAVNTNFVNSTGLHDDNHYTTAKDMALITKAALKNPEFASIWGNENYTLASTNLTEGYRIWHSHNLLRSNSEYYYKYATGGKTGYTDEAGRTLVTVAEKNGLKLICIIMKSDNEHIFTDTSALFEYGFQNFIKTNIKDAETRFGSGAGIPVIEKLYGRNSRIFSLSNDSVLLPSNVALSDIPYTLEFVENPENNVIATITYQYLGNYLGKAALSMNLASQQTSMNGPVKNTAQETNSNSASIKETTSINIYILAGLIVTIIVLLLIIIQIIRYRRIQKKRRRRNIYL